MTKMELFQHAPCYGVFHVIKPAHNKLWTTSDMLSSDFTQSAWQEVAA
jgi:hypothetical protein